MLLKNSYSEGDLVYLTPGIYCHVVSAYGDIIIDNIF